MQSTLLFLLYKQYPCLYVIKCFKSWGSSPSEYA